MVKKVKLKFFNHSKFESVTPQFFTESTVRSAKMHSEGIKHVAT